LEIASNAARNINSMPMEGRNFGLTAEEAFSKVWIEHECGGGRNALGCRIKHADLASPPYNLMDNQVIDARVTAMNLNGGAQTALV
jgi:hypothetical protein